MTAVGRSIRRVEGLGKVTGVARYVGDIVRPGLLHAAFVRSPYPHARIRSVDDSGARAVRGVVEVLSADTAGDLLPVVLPYDIACGSLERPADAPTMPGDPLPFDRVVRFVGDPVALVVGETEQAARAGADAVAVEYEPLPAVLDPSTARDPDTRRLHERCADNVASSHHWTNGDLEAAFATAALVVERTFRTQRQKHAQLEPTACLAEPDGDGGVVLHAPSQVPHRLRHEIARMYGLRANRVRVVVPAIGGAFGKNEGLSAEPYAVAAALATNRPVRLVYDRQEDMTATDVRHPMEMTLRGAFREDGSLIALQARTLIDAGAYLGHSTIVAPVIIAQLLATYRLTAFDVEAVAVFTNHQSSGAFRGYGGPQAVFPLECLIDLACDELGVDPIAARRAMHVRAGDAYGPLGIPLTGTGMEQCLDAGAEAFGWDRREARRQASAGADGIRRGFGMACVAWKSGIVGAGFDESAARATLEADGSVTLATASPDLGTGIHTTLTQICAEALGVDPERVRLTATDTAATPFDVGAFASRSLYRMGAAVERAGTALRERVLAEAARGLEIDAGDLDLAGDAVVVRGSPDRRMTLGAVAHNALHEGRELSARGEAPRTMAPAFAAQFAEVEVDTATGQVGVVRIVSAQDVGRAINPAVVVGQIHGAVVQGLGYALSEDLVVDRDTGTVLAGTFGDYAISTAADVPPIDVVLVEDPDPTGPYGARGAGEPAITLTAPAIANAVLDALGTAPTTLPLTPDVVRAAAERSRATLATRAGIEAPRESSPA